MTLELVPFQQGILIPRDWKAVGAVVCIPGTLPGYQGPAALALTKEALHLCGPDGLIHSVHYENVRDVNICDLKGTAIERPTSVGTVLANPREAYGVEVTYEPPATVRRRLRVLVFFHNVAAEWVGAIIDAIDGFNSTKLPNPQSPITYR